MRLAILSDRQAGRLGSLNSENSVVTDSKNLRVKVPSLSSYLEILGLTYWLFICLDKCSGIG